MPPAVQTIRYGFTALAALVITGTTIYVADNTRRQVQPVDVIEYVLGVQERCLATLYSTNPAPAYRVAPLELVQERFTNGYTRVVSAVTSVVAGVTNVLGVTNLYVVRETYMVTNRFGWYIDKAMLDACDGKLYELIGCYADPHFDLTDTNANPTYCLLTVSNLFSSLQIGDRTNLFTRTPAYGTNPATYGTTMGWPIHEINLVERYKVLTELTRTREAPAGSKNGSFYGVDTHFNTLEGYQYSNQVTSALYTGYVPSWLANTIGLPGDTNWPASYITNTIFRFLTWEELMGQAYPWRWYHFYNTLSWGPPLSNDFFTVATNLENLAAGEVVQTTIQLREMVQTGDGPVAEFNWYVRSRKQYATFYWTDVENTNFTSTARGVFMQPVVAEFSQRTEMATNAMPPSPTNAWAWYFPRSWQNNVRSSFPELAHMNNANWWRIRDADVFTTTEGQTAIRFGKGMANLREDGSFHDSSVWPDEPSKGTGFGDNSGSVGTAAGCMVHGSFNGDPTIWLLKDWEFQYATTRFW